jgi:hypothetical protein
MNEIYQMWNLTIWMNFDQTFYGGWNWQPDELLVKIKAVIFTYEICHKLEIDQMKTFDPIDEIYSTNELYYVYIIIVDGVINMHATTNM